MHIRVPATANQPPVKPAGLAMQMRRRMRHAALRRWCSIMLAWSVVAAGLPVAHAGIGDLDPGYGVNGRFEARRYGEFFVYPPLSDGRVLYPTDGGYRRTDANGLPDASFGSGGVQLWPQRYESVGTGGWARAWDGRLFVVLRRPGPDGTEHALMRLGLDGEQDLTFGTNGLVAIDVPPDGTRSASLAVQPDGKPLLLLARHDPSDWYYLDRILLIRLLADGRPDTTFGTGGVVSVPTNRVETMDGVSLSLLADGRVVVYANPVAVVSEFGVPTIGSPSDTSARGIALLPGGEVIEWAATDTGCRLTKVLADGSVDASFGPNGDGTAELPPGTGGQIYLSGVSVSNDGHHIYLSWGRQTDGRWRVSRLFANGPGAGKFDTSFGDHGTVDLKSTGVIGAVYGLADGSAIVTTATYAYRLLGRAEPSPGFTGQLGVGPGIWPESDGAAELRFFRAAGSDGAIRLRYWTPPESELPQVSWSWATPGVDFDAQDGVLDWSDGDDSDKVIRIPLRRDQLVEGTEHISVRFEALSPGTWNAEGGANVGISGSASASNAPGGQTAGAARSAGGGGGFGWLTILGLVVAALPRAMRGRKVPVAVSLLLSVPVMAQAAPGDVDPGFVYPRPMALEPDSTLELSRIDEDGRLVVSFAVGGQITHTLPGRINVSTAATQVSDGSFLLAGFQREGEVDGSIAAIVRLDSAGQLDRGFGNQGVATFDVPGELDRVGPWTRCPTGASLRRSGRAWSRYHTNAQSTRSH